MKTENRLIISIVALLIWFFLSSNYLGVFLARVFIFQAADPFQIASFVVLSGIGIWALLEAIIIIKKKENRDAVPLILMAIWISILGIFSGVAGVFTTILNLVEGGIFQAISFFLYFVSIIIFLMLGIWSLMKGIILIREKSNKKLAIWNVIIGGIIVIPPLFYIIIDSIL